MNNTASNTGSSVEYINNIPNVPPAAPYFSQLVWAGNTAYLSGVIGMSPVTNKLAEGGISAEAEQIFDNIENTLKGAGLTFNDLAKVSIYLTSMADFQKMNEIYIRRMGSARPARETVAVNGLALNSAIEITVTAYKN